MVRTRSGPSAYAVRSGRVGQTGRRVYWAEGVTLIRPRKPYLTAVTKREAVLSFERQDFPRGVLKNWNRAKVDAAIYIVTERNPVYPGQHPGITYPAWVVTLDHAPSLITGGAVQTQPRPQPPYDCQNVGIFDLRISEWTDFFQTCHR